MHTNNIEYYGKETGEVIGSITCDWEKDWKALAKHAKKLEWERDQARKIIVKIKQNDKRATRSII